MREENKCFPLIEITLHNYKKNVLKCEENKAKSDRYIFNWHNTPAA
jgi:hypothetical protein